MISIILVIYFYPFVHNLSVVIESFRIYISFVCIQTIFLLHLVCIISCHHLRISHCIIIMCGFIMLMTYFINLLLHLGWIISCHHLRISLHIIIMYAFIMLMCYFINLHYRFRKPCLLFEITFIDYTLIYEIFYTRPQCSQAAHLPSTKSVLNLDWS